MGALLRFRRIGDVFRFAIFLRHREQFLHLNRTELFTSTGNPVYDRNVVAQVKEQQQCIRRREANESRATSSNPHYHDEQSHVTPSN